MMCVVSNSEHVHVDDPNVDGPIGRSQFPLCRSIAPSKNGSVSRPCVHQEIDDRLDLDPALRPPLWEKRTTLTRKI